MKILCVLWLLAIPLAAGTILNTGDTYTAQYGIWNWSIGATQSCSGCSQFPTKLELSAGIELPAVSSASLPNTTQQYYPGILFESWIESADGGTRIDLTGAYSSSLGLPAGEVMATLGSFTSNGVLTPVGDLEAYLAFPSVSDAQAFFGAAALVRDAPAFELYIRNLGSPVSLLNRSLGARVSDPMAGFGAGAAGQGSYITQAPEPSSTALVIVGLAGLLTVCRELRFRKANRSHRQFWSR